MKILNVFDVAREGSFEQFLYLYKNSDEYSEIFGLNLLKLALVNDKFLEEKIKILYKKY